MAEPRVWWGTGVVFVGLGAAMLAGAGVAAADTEASDGAAATTSSSPSTGDDSSFTSDAGAQSPATVVADSRTSPVDNDSFDTNSVDTLQRKVAEDDSEEDGALENGALDVDVLDAGDEPDASAAAVESMTPAQQRSPAAASATGDTESAASATAEVAAPKAAAEVAADASASAELAAVAPASPDTVTGVKTGHAKLTIPIDNGYTTAADWYFPTQADGSVSATGVIWLQHGFLNRKSFVSALATTLSQDTNSIVVAPNVASFPWRCRGCWLNGVEMQQAVATMFLGDRAGLTTSATAAGYLSGLLPEDFVLSGQSAGGGFATAVGGYYASDPTNERHLRGVVMFDGFSFSGVVPTALQSLDDPFIPVYQVAAPPQMWNSFGATTAELVAARPGQFVGATLARGSHADSLLGGNPLIDFFAQLVTKFSPPGNTAATHTLSTGWINDMYRGLGPTDGTGIYGSPDQYIVMGDTAAVVLSPPPVVDVQRYLGTWYEVGSVKQFFSIGLVNTKAVYSLNPDGSIKVENSGNYFFNNGPESTIVGSALPVDPANNKLNVSFVFPAKANPPGNYWIVDLSPDYDGPNGWAIVSDPTGLSGFLLSRSPIVSDQLYQELLDRASVKGVRGWITVTRQPWATTVVAT